MPQITLNSKQVNELAAFIKKHNLKTFFLAKDEGAYVGATAGSHETNNFESVIFYFRGMNPHTDGDEWYDNAHYAFGGDDFGEFLNVEFILKMAEKIDPKVTIKVTENAIKMDGKFKSARPEPKATPLPKVPTKADGSKETKGAQIRRLLTAGVSPEIIVKMVDTTINSVRWHASKMKAEA